ncbi:small ribosomal subunit protein mS26-like [Watersipora subatra]|uniref:small ribosomal subunit protein mS26-like n=1 Tax=Watersipora subatra TaxID=2589382 RepID=UPI00355B7101
MNVLSQTIRFTRLSLENSKVINNFSTTSVRFRKKRFVPRRAPSKMYYVREPTPKDHEETQILKKELNIYNTQMKSIYAYLKSQSQPISQMVKESAPTSDDNQADLERSIQLNAAWNERLADERAVRKTAEDEAVAKIKRQKLEKYLTELNFQHTEALSSREYVKVKRAGAIDMENLDEELEKFLERDPVDHNFAITRTGERISN